jgi:hypothetical protein
MTAKEHVKRVRAAVAAFVKNREDFAKVTLTLARELFEAREAVGGDDSAFGAWLATHQLAEKITAQDRAALIKLGQHSKIAAKVLRETTSRSVRIIWENELRPLVQPRPALAPQPRTFTSAGKGEQPTITIEDGITVERSQPYTINGQTRILTNGELTETIPFTVHVRPSERIFPPQEEIDRLGAEAVATAQRKRARELIENPPDRENRVTDMLVELRCLAPHVAGMIPGDLDALVDFLLHGEMNPQHPIPSFRREKLVGEVMAILDVMAELRDKLRVALEQQRLVDAPRPTVN